MKDPASASLRGSDVGHHWASALEPPARSVACAPARFLAGYGCAAVLPGPYRAGQPGAQCCPCLSTRSTSIADAAVAAASRASRSFTAAICHLRDRLVPAPPCWTPPIIRHSGCSGTGSRLRDLVLGQSLARGWRRRWIVRAGREVLSGRSLEPCRVGLGTGLHGRLDLTGATATG